ncbi:hypothetical protein RM572_00525 [Streptomyces sp. DSM 42041]|uniref:Uncharacterized protein n=1 Tax=Streptomyces hazeniae TaxID=3075538 RepID=A0ABU2NKG9_9ACTN|nr:hypothetical protein [Streptomyces sp. DSM 42041]MDT0377260.1 hypothetical protein [Streptomyces sp. DSM 42041]
MTTTLTAPAGTKLRRLLAAAARRIDTAAGIPPRRALTAALTIASRQVHPHMPPAEEHQLHTEALNTVGEDVSTKQLPARLTALATAEVPPLPTAPAGCGYDWAARLTGGWAPLYDDADGNPLGDGADLLLATYDDEAAGLFALAVHDFGANEVTTYTSRDARATVAAAHRL